MQPQYRRPYREDPTSEIWIGPSTWDPQMLASKFAWRTATGAWARGGEHPLNAIIDEIALATKTRTIDWLPTFIAVLEQYSPDDAATEFATIVETAAQAFKVITEARAQGVNQPKENPT